MIDQQGATAKYVDISKAGIKNVLFYYIIPVFSNKFNAEFSRKLIKRLKIFNCNHSQKKMPEKIPFSSDL